MANPRRFGDRTQIARTEHFCDSCFEWIQPGEEYTREIWVSETGNFHAMKEHSNPGCKLFDPAEDREEAPIRMSLQMALETRQVVSLVFQRNGSVASRTDTILVQRMVCVTENPDDSIAPAIELDDDEVPF